MASRIAPGHTSILIVVVNDDEQAERARPHENLAAAVS